MGLRRRRVLFVESLNLKALLPPDKIVQGITLAMERGLVETYGNDTIIEHANFTEFLTGCLGLKPLHGPTGVLAEVGRITGSTPNEQGFSTSVASLHVNGVISAVVFKDGAYHRRYL